MHGFLSPPQMEDKEPSHGLQEKLIPKMLNFGNLDLWPVLLLLVVEGSPHSFSSVQTSVEIDRLSDKCLRLVHDIQETEQLAALTYIIPVIIQGVFARGPHI